MVHKVYIESLNGFPINDCGVSALLGFRMKGTDVIFFEDIEEVPTSKYNIVVGCIETTNKYFERFNLPPKRGLNIPPSISRYARRKHYNTTFLSIKEGIENKNITFPFFIKPVKAKQFVAGVVNNENDFNIYFYNVDENTECMVSNVVKFVSEYRGYVIDKQLVGLYWYIGDFRIFPNVNVIDEAIKEYTDQPIGYSIDFGITDKGETILIECNDGWSLGNYGLHSTIYAKLLAYRWKEIMKNC